MSWSIIPQCLELKRTAYFPLALSAAYSSRIAKRHHFESRLLRSLPFAPTVIAFHVNAKTETRLLLLQCLLTKVYPYTTLDGISYFCLSFLLRMTNIKFRHC